MIVSKDQSLQFDPSKSFCSAVGSVALLGFSPKILGFSKQSWVLGFFLRALGFF